MTTTNIPKISLDLSTLSTSIIESESQRQKSFDIASQLKVALAKARHTSLQQYTEQQQPQPTAIPLQSTTNDNDDTLSSLVTQAMQIDRTRQPPSLFYAIQDHIRLQAYRHFLTQLRSTTTADDEDGFRFLLSPSSPLYQFPHTTTTNDNPSHSYDEDYLMGIMGLTQDLSRFAIAAGTNRDGTAVTHARNLVRDVLEYLMTFDFRNGMLRRKYDGVKYALKTCETVLYELSVTGCVVGGGGGGEEDCEMVEQPEKRLKKNPLEEEEDPMASNTPPTTPSPTEGIRNELETIRQRIEHRDDVRETLIKRCRDAQKKAKQAIYALHRGDTKRADTLLQECETITKADLIPIVEKERSLRLGSSLGGVLEEYAEAKLFQAWILGIEDSSGGGGADGKSATTAPQCTLLQPHHLTAKLPLTDEEYLGGLCDLTGEVGRYAVQRGTVRDSEGVRRCLTTNRAILYALELLERLPSMGGIGKKMDPLRHSVEKLERMCYELSLVEATGRSIVVDSVKENPGRGEAD